MYNYNLLSLDTTMVRGSIKIIKCFAVNVFYQWLIWAVANEPTQLS